MKYGKLTIFICILLLLLSGCAGSGPVATGGNAVQAEELPGFAGPIPEGRADWAEVYTAFVEKNHEKLQATCFGGVAGVGFADLDLDGTPEMILFDSGASAYMGVQLFDIVEDAVVCVSASSVSAGLAFGEDSLSPLYVDALFFDDFRLMRAADGRRWFQVMSKNGAGDFYYNELLRLTGTDGRLTLDSIWYKRITTDPATGEETGGVYTVAGEPASAEALAAAENAAIAAGEDTGYTAAGVFLWTDKSYGYNYDGLMAMVHAAVAAYVPIE